MPMVAQPPRMPFVRPPPAVAVDVPPMVANWMRALLPAWPAVAAVKLTVALADRVRPENERSAELMPVPPRTALMKDALSARATAPMVSVVAVCARPRSSMTPPRRVIGAASLTRLFELLALPAFSRYRPPV